MDLVIQIVESFFFNLDDQNTINSLPLSFTRIRKQEVSSKSIMTVILPHKMYVFLHYYTTNDYSFQTANALKSNRRRSVMHVTAPLH